jgi:hypothetical protein
MGCNSYLCVPITGTSVLSRLEGFSVAMMFLSGAGLYVYLLAVNVLGASGVRLVVNGSTVLGENIQSSGRWTGGARSPPADKESLGTCKICHDAGATQFWVNLKSSPHRTAICSLLCALSAVQNLCVRSSCTAIHPRLSPSPPPPPTTASAWQPSEALQPQHPRAARTRQQLNHQSLAVVPDSGTLLGTLLPAPACCLHSHPSPPGLHVNCISASIKQAPFRSQARASVERRAVGT